MREQIRGIALSDRYEEITNSFNSIRDDARSIVKQVEYEKINTLERLQNIWMKVTRGDVAARFDKIKLVYLDVAEDSRDQVEREHIISNAYQDFRGAVKESEVLALEVLKKAEEKLNVAKRALDEANKAVADFTGDDKAELARLELGRDERLRDVQDEEKRYQVAKDLAHNLTVSYHTSEVIIARLRQTTSAKECVDRQAITFFGTNETGANGADRFFYRTARFARKHADPRGDEGESQQESGRLGGDWWQVQEAAVRARYGPTIRFEAVKKLVDSVTAYQERSREIIQEMRVLSTKNAEEIRVAVEDRKQRLALLTSAAPAPN